MAKKNKEEKEELKLNLSFERKIEVSNGIFKQSPNASFDLSSYEERNVKIINSSFIGTQSSRDIDNSTKGDESKANIQNGDKAFLDYGCKDLIVEFNCKILPVLKPWSAPLEAQEHIEQYISLYKENISFKELAERFALNFINGRWLWRNRMIAREIDIQIELLLNGNNKEKLLFKDIKKISLNKMKYDFIENEKVNEEEKHNFEKLTKVIQDGFENKNFAIFNVKAILKNVDEGQEVFPSQRFEKNSKDRSLSYIEINNEKCAIFHSQKISNAIKTIDDFYEKDAKFVLPIEPYGTKLDVSHAFRKTNTKNDVFTLFDNVFLKNNNTEYSSETDLQGKFANLTEEEKNKHHFLIANMIRGFLYTTSTKDKE